MKKLFMIIALVALSTMVWAQNKGDNYLDAGVSTSFGFQKITTTNGVQSVHSTEPMNTAFGLQAGYGYFLADNIRLEVSFGFEYQGTPTKKSGSHWLRNKTSLFAFNPSLAYYFKLADKLYYTPELGMLLAAGKFVEEETVNLSSDYSYNGFEAYLQPIALEFKANDKIALGMAIGSIQYVRTKMHDPTSGLDIIGNGFVFNLNTASVLFRLYF